VINSSIKVPALGTSYPSDTGAAAACAEERVADKGELVLLLGEAPADVVKDRVIVGFRVEVILIFISFNK
jgi:hypothetical protein